MCIFKVFARSLCNFIGFFVTFLHCVFSNVSANRLPQKRHSRIGCICLAFDHCVFSSVFLKHLAQSRHSHIGCIYLTFLHCGFVKCLHKLLDFSSPCVLKYILKSPDHIALFAFVWVFPPCVFKCVLKLAAREDEKSQLLQYKCTKRL